jgi:hypothetical protein
MTHRLAADLMRSLDALLDAPLPSVVEAGVVETVRPRKHVRCRWCFDTGTRGSGAVCNCEAGD